MHCREERTYKLIQALMQRLITSPSQELGTIFKVGTLKIGWEKWLLDMVGIATLSDMVPLSGENRLFAYYGLKVLQKSPRKGLRKLLTTLKVAQRYLTADDIGFTIGPRIHAASPTGVPM